MGSICMKILSCSDINHFNSQLKIGILNVPPKKYYLNLCFLLNNTLTRRIRSFPVKILQSADAKKIQHCHSETHIY